MTGKHFVPSVGDFGGRATARVAGVTISHPDRLIYTEPKISKIELARYYETIADWIVPHAAGRPLTLVHCPAGLAAPCNYMKHAKAWGPGTLRRVKIQEKTKVGVADAIVRTNSRLYTTTFVKAGRERKILIDYLRNNRTNTTICAFSPRARAGAPVSMPISWNTLGAGPDRWTLTTVPRYLGRSPADPWALYWSAAQYVSEAAFAAVQRL